VLKCKGGGVTVLNCEIILRNFVSLRFWKCVVALICVCVYFLQHLCLLLLFLCVCVCVCVVLSGDPYM
jgi:hypothetical protein